MCSIANFKGHTNSRRVPGIEGVYLIHAESPVGNKNHQAQHYLGWSWNMQKRFVAHKKGLGSSITRAFRRKRIVLRMVRVWPGTNRRLERRIKDDGHIKFLCPICNPDLSQRRFNVAKAGETTDNLPFDIDFRHLWPVGGEVRQKFFHHYPHPHRG